MRVMIQTAVLVAAILAVRRIFGKKLHAYIRYGLWLLVALRLLIPVNFIDSPFSVFRAEDALAGWYEEMLDTAGTLNAGFETGSFTMTASGEPPAGDDGSVRAQGDETGTDGKAAAAAHPADGSLGTPAGEQAKGGGGHGASGKNLLQSGGMGRWIASILRRENAGRTAEMAAGIFRAIWITGSIFVGGFLVTAHLCFRSRLYRVRRPCRSSQPAEGTIHGASGPFRRRQTVSGRAVAVPVYHVDKLESPCLAGIIHPAVYIGSNVEAGSDEFRYIVAHEKVHYLHGDHIWAMLRVVLVTVYWFHPFVWLAARASARDGEIACDYGTVRQLGEKERMAYGMMLIGLCGSDRGKRIYSYGTMLRPGKSEIKERILRLTGENGGRKWAGVLVILVMLAVMGCAFTKKPQNNRDDGTTPAMEEDTAPQEDDGNISGHADLSGDEGTDNSGNAMGTEAFDPEEAVTGQRQLAAAPAALSEETAFGADGPILDYAGQLGTGGESIIIFHDYFGLAVYGLTSGKVLQSLDLARIGCHMTQGDNACQVSVSADGRTVWLHPGSRQYMFRYEVEKNLLYQLPLVKTFEIDLEAEDLFERYAAVEEEYAVWHSNYLYEEYKDEKGLHTTYIYLEISDGDGQKLRNLQCVWDDMVYNLCRDGVWPGREGAKGDFPYRYDGVVADTMILYDEPCMYSRISDSYGSRENPVTGDSVMHEGIDYAAEEGTDITAAADGVVYEKGSSDEYGAYVVLLHENGDMTYYCHCREIAVEEGTQVKRGERIAAVGNTGRSTGAHLHFALSRYGEFVDPAMHMASGKEDAAP